MSAIYSSVQGGLSGTSNIDSNPIFVDLTNGDYNYQIILQRLVLVQAVAHLQRILMASSSPSGSSPDIGAYENSRSAPLEPTNTTYLLRQQIGAFK